MESTDPGLRVLQFARSSAVRARFFWCMCKDNSFRDAAVSRWQASTNDHRSVSVRGWPSKRIFSVAQKECWRVGW